MNCALIRAYKKSLCDAMAKRIAKAIFEILFLIRISSCCLMKKSQAVSRPRLSQKHADDADGMDLRR
jgi:hypothetical protein